MSKEDKEIVAVLECSATADIPSLLWVGELTKDWCRIWLKLMRELSKRDDVQYYEAFNYIGMYGEAHNVLDEKNATKIKKIVEEEHEAVDCCTFVISKDDLHFEALLKHSDLPIHIETTCLSRELLEAIVADELTPKLRKQLKTGIVGR